MAAPIALTEHTYLLPSGSNSGLIVADGKAIIVDAGLDADTARRVAKAVADLRAQPVALLLTHAHADHFGGAAAIAERFGIPVYAPALEAAVVENPYLEPQFLFSGAAPVPELLGKFTLATPCRVSALVEPGPLEVGGVSVEVVALPGHAPNQVGYAFGETLFCGDVFFPSETLAKHPIPFCADVGRALDTLQRLPGMPYGQFAPGHGPALTDPAAECRANADRLLAIADIILRACAVPMSTSDLVKAVMDALGATLNQIAQYCLAQTTVLACAAWLRAAGRLDVVFADNRMLWARSTA